MFMDIRYAGFPAGYPAIFGKKPDIRIRPNTKISLSVQITRQNNRLSCRISGYLAGYQKHQKHSIGSFRFQPDMKNHMPAHPYL